MAKGIYSRAYIENPFARCVMPTRRDAASPWLAATEVVVRVLDRNVEIRVGFASVERGDVRGPCIPSPTAFVRFPCALPCPVVTRLHGILMHEGFVGKFGINSSDGLMKRPITLFSSAASSRTSSSARRRRLCAHHCQRQGPCGCRSPAYRATDASGT